MSERYKDFVMLDTPTDFCETELFSSKYSVIQIHHNYPIDNGVIGFVGVCKVKDGKLIPLDGDSYTEHMPIVGYSEFRTKYNELGLDILVNEW